ncbi:uncharacterized protein Z518_08624 [Rhinocladiella mackenziei CBS 650.93]|uniref:Uncharacterized protein n=1 Tax=Rhinocladiella mackenziei CBS 650.93 TaxID=1442369 RepID=A0A0D2FL46_9EURO|nr:uncharacterized protein Z518_08624 [Rhinocladiella mackenziei CBS 650.93]KIX02682.1 hypothetical protein Z518_08624 [Rhinocladiella mackenziei CBS 650.93]
MTFTRADRDRFEDLRRKKRVHFKGSVGAAEWPPTHRHNFAAIRSLGDLKYDEYSVGAHPDLVNEPWKNRVKELAAELTERASRCCRRNEASWRFACEPVIFARMNADVTCPQCRGRLWRSEIEVSWEGNSRRAAALRKRQESRRPCRCPRSTRQNDPHEAIGLNRIFTHREQELILHSRDLAEELSKEQYPDRIYGLRQTRNFEETLYSHAKCESAQDDKLVRDLVDVSPLSLDGDPLLFPFLILEAKSGKSEDDWHSIKLQTTFPIRTCLDVQHTVQRASGNDCRWRSGPLVWFFMNKGEDWRLCAAYIQTRPCPKGQKPRNDYYIIDLWNGSIISKDGALQLLLIVDYIFDWARDSFRQEILTELRTLSRGVEESTSTFPDTDLMSTKEIAIPRAPDHSVGGDQERDLDLRSASHPCDSKWGMVRHAAFVEDRFCMLFITRDNVQTLLQSTSPNVVKLLARLILAQILAPVFILDIETLDALEEQWTGTARLSRPFGFTHIKFFTAFTFGTYMGLSWVQLRELCVIAVAEDAFESVVAGSKLRPGRGNARRPTPSPVEKVDVTLIVSRFQATTPQQTLLAAIKRILLRCLPPLFRTDDLQLTLDDGTLRNIVGYVYKYFKKGVLEPSESFLRVSSRHVQIQTESGDENLHHHFKDLDNDLNEDLLVSKSGAVLICGYGPNAGIQRSKQSDNCIYFVGNPVEALDQSGVAAAIKDTFENFDVYHTTRNNGTDNIRSPSKGSRAPWNLERVYGIDTRPIGFVRWLKCLGSDVMSRQGSPRDPNGSGNYLLTRNIRPWHDPRLIWIRQDYEIFLLYKLMTTELLYWRGVAQERMEQGIVCCQACAAQDSLIQTSEPFMCSRCWQEIQAPRFPRWVSDTLAGGRPGKWTRVEEQNYSSPDLISTKHHWWNDSLNTYTGGDLPPQEQWYKDVSEYPDLDKEFVDLGDLHKQALGYAKYKGKRYGVPSAGSRKRSRSPSTSDTE